MHLRIVCVLGSLILAGVLLVGQAPGFPRVGSHGHVPQHPGRLSVGQGPASTPHEIQVSARRYQFTPATITVKKGEQVRIAITAVDHDHGFKLEAFNIEKTIKKGTTEVVELTADKAGTFPFQCSHFCGMGHGKMKGQLVVEE